MTDTPRLKVLPGGRDKQLIINSVTLQVVAESLQPLPADIRVFEEDSHLVLTVDPVMRFTPEHPIRLMTSVMKAKPRTPGTIVVNRKSWYAIIHDLDRDPTWRPEWIEQAYRNTLTLAEEKDIQRLGLPLLGSVHGSFPAAASLTMLTEMMHSFTFRHLRKILVLVSRDCISLVAHQLADMCDRESNASTDKS